MKKDAYYFKHDSNARNDEKLLVVRRMHGMEGYGTYWGIIEKLRESKDYTLSKDYDSISWELRVDEDIVKKIVENYGLFTVTDDKFYSARLCGDMVEWDEKKEARRQAGIIGMQSRWGKKDKEESEIKVLKEEVVTKKTKEKKYTKEETKLHGDCKKYFDELYRRYKGIDFYWSAKEMTAIVNIIAQIKFYMKEEQRNDLDKVFLNFRAFTDSLFARGGNWITNNTSPSNINSKFNEIYSQLKNGKDGNKSTANSGNARDNRDYIASLAGNIRSGADK
ncbi:MAG: DUF4373 domain-containing protein [Bacteroidales bacterium]|nr:DUF4373 domain-containing protein [Bacteroidales bacterium]